MIQSRFKYTTDTGAKASQLAYKLRSKKKDLFANIAVPIGILVMVGVLIYDITKKSSIVLDVILLSLLLFLEILNIAMPFIIGKSQKKYLAKLEEQNFDYYISEYDDNLFKEKYYKDSKMIYCNHISIDKLVNVAEFEHYVLLIFNNYATLVFDIEKMQSGNKDELLKLATNAIAMNRLKRRNNK